MRDAMILAATCLLLLADVVFVAIATNFNLLIVIPVVLSAAFLARFGRRIEPFCGTRRTKTVGRISELRPHQQPRTLRLFIHSRQTQSRII
jgi:hypothetical protein